jgi:hypothetical protein
MDRTAATTYLTSEFSDIAKGAKFTTAQIDTAYATAINNALRQLDYAETDLATADVEQVNIKKYIALLEYFALKRFLKPYGTKYDVKVGSGAVDASKSQAFDMLRQLFADAEADLARLGIPLGGLASFEMGRINLDFLEPSKLGEF